MSEHPFYCHKKKCRKTAWNTPEYLNESNWTDLKTIIEWIETKNIDLFYKFITTQGDRSKNFFYKVIGWPEGYNYCQVYEYFKNCGLDCIYKNGSLEQMKEAVEKHYENL